jgi:hypothetical protein
MFLLFVHTAPAFIVELQFFFNCALMEITARRAESANVAITLSRATF